MESLEKNENGMQALLNYEAPAIEILEIAAEKGFAQGGPTYDNPDPKFP